jgi:hypothetical protein
LGTRGLARSAFSASWARFSEKSLAKKGRLDTMCIGEAN